MSDVQDFAKFLNKIKAGGDGVTWTGEHLDALDKIFRGSRYFCHIVGDELVIPTTLPMESRMMLTRAWGGFRMLGAIIRRHVVPDTDGGTGFDWGYDPVVDSTPVANPDGIRPETKFEEFVRRLREDQRLPPTFEIWTHPGEGIHYLSKGYRTIGTIANDVLSLSSDCDRFTGAWLRETWRSLDAPPAIPPRVHRFLEALVGSRFVRRARLGELITAPFTVKHYPKEGLIELAGSGVQFGTVRGDRFSPYEQIIGEEASISLERFWDETGNQTEIPFRVRRFLDALDSNGVRLMYDRIRPLQAPFSATISAQGVASLFARGVNVGMMHKVGEIHGDTLSIDGLIAVQDRMILDYLWRETSGKQDLLARMSTLVAELAAKVKTSRPDQIDTPKVNS